MASLTPERWRLVSQVLERVLDLPPEERNVVLEETCRDRPWLRAEVEKLLGADARAGEFLEKPLGEIAATLVGDLEREGTDRDADTLRGSRVGPFRIVREIGRGGMAVVYLAERTGGQFEQRVALKIMKPGMDTGEVLRRFEQERQILACLDHPGIARLIDGGRTEDGRPYIAMERVEGLPIDRYCDANGLTVEGRLRLFETVCRAVQFAHRNLVIHRDLKPSNIVVTDRGEVKLLDFGIAKLLDPEAYPHAAPPTRTSVRPMTPEYASPEQVRGEPVTTASDVYQLGLLLYELLTGLRAQRLAGRSASEAERIVAIEDPARPSIAVREDRLARQLQGDLDNIVMMSIRKDPERRYGSVDLLIRDLENHHRGLPVSARPDTFGYRARKFVGRHRLAAGMGTALVLLALGFIVTLIVQSNRIASERDRARTEATRAEEVTGFLIDLFEVSSPYESKAEEITARELLDRGAERLDYRLLDQPESRAALLGAVGQIYRNLGMYERAREELEESLSIERDLHPAGSVETAAVLNRLGLLLEDQGEFEAAEPIMREALEMRTALLGENHASVAETMNDLAVLLRRRSDYDGAEALQRRALELRRDLFGASSAPVAESLQNLGRVLTDRGDYEEAEALLREAVAMYREELGDDHLDLATGFSNLAVVLRRQGKLDDAEAPLREALKIRRSRYGEAHPEVALSLNNLALVLRDRGDLEGAAATMRQALGLYVKILGPDQSDVAIVMINLALVLNRQQKRGEAEALLRDAIAIFRVKLPEDHAYLGWAYQNLGRLFLDTGRHREAESLFRDAVRIRAKAYGEKDWRTMEARLFLGNCLAAEGRFEEAEALLEMSYEALHAIDHRLTRTALESLVTFYEKRGDDEKRDYYRDLFAE